VGRVTEKNGAKRTVAVVPVSRTNRRSHDHTNRTTDDSHNFIVYSGFDQLTLADLEGTSIHNHVSAQDNEMGLPRSFSAHMIEEREGGQISAQGKDESSLVETVAAIEEGQVHTESSSSTALVSLLSESENNEISSAQGCDTCVGEYVSCTSYNPACVLFVATLYAGSLGACYTCYQTGGLAEAAGVCTVCISGLVGNTVGTMNDFTCDIGHHCSEEYGCVPSNQGHLCDCGSSSTGGYCG